MNIDQQKHGHKCDVYACLALSEDGSSVIHEFRIPPIFIGDRRVIHIPCEFKGTQWELFRVSRTP